jgi:hypothetical protein
MSWDPLLCTVATCAHEAAQLMRPYRGPGRFPRYVQCKAGSGEGSSTKVYSYRWCHVSIQRCPTNINVLHTPLTLMKVGFRPLIVRLSSIT